MYYPVTISFMWMYYPVNQPLPVDWCAANNLRGPQTFDSLERKSWFSKNLNYTTKNNPKSEEKMGSSFFFLAVQDSVKGLSLKAGKGLTALVKAL